MIAVTDSAGTPIATNRYDEYGQPASSNASISNGGRFQYTGQAWLPELGLYHYKARTYNPTLGRFMQSDPIGYGDGMNMNNYVGGDPVNATDPSGAISCTGTRIDLPNCLGVAGLYCIGNCSYTVTFTIRQVAGPGPGGTGITMDPESAALIASNPGLASCLFGAGDGGIQVCGGTVYLSGAMTYDPHRPAPAGSQKSCSVIANSEFDLKQSYLDAMRGSFDLFFAIGGNREVAYSIFRNNDSGGLTPIVDIGRSGAVDATLSWDGHTLVLSGHIHDRPVGPSGLFGWNYAGPSQGDIDTRSNFPSAIFILHEKAGDKWRNVCF